MFFSASKPIVNTIERYDPKAVFRPRQMFSVHVVREHLNPLEMHLNILKLKLNQALRDNEDSGH